MLCFCNTNVMIDRKWFSIHFNFLTHFSIGPWFSFANIVPTWSNDCLEKEHLNKKYFHIFGFCLPAFMSYKIDILPTLSNSKETESSNFKIFYAIAIVLHAWGLSLNALKFLFWVYGLLTSSYRRTLKQKCDFNKITKQLYWRGCSPADLLHIFRTPFTKNTSGWLLLDIMDSKKDLRSFFPKGNIAKVKSIKSICIKYHRWNRDPVCTTGSKEASCWKPLWKHSIENKARDWKLCRNSWS